MKASFGKKLAVLCLSAAMAVGIGFGVSNINTAQADTLYRDFTEISASYKLNTTVSVTDDSTVEGVKFPKTIDVSSTVKASAYLLTYPDGVVVSLAEPVALNQLGNYKISYKSYENSVPTVYYDTFNVHNNFTNDNDSVELYERTTYKAYEKCDKGTLYKASEIYTETPTTTEVYKVDKGVRATLASGTFVTFNNIINANENADEEGFVTLATVNLVAVDRSPNRATASLINKYFDFQFTDVNDPNNYIKVVSTNQVGSIGHSFGVETGTTPLIGTADTNVANAVEKEGSVRIFYVDGVRNAAFINQTRTWGNGEHLFYDYSFLYNPTTKVVKQTCVRRFNFENGQFDTFTQDVIIDLDNPDIFDNGATLFNGFSTGEVKLSISARDFSGSEAYVDVFALGNLAGEELQAYYTNDTIVDTTAPTIKIDAKVSDESGIYAAFDPDKKNTKYFVPAAYAQDANECSPVTYKVYKNYSDKTEGAKVLVDVNDDGSFTIAENVIYTIEYKTADIYGNVGYNTLNIIPVVAADLGVNGDVVYNDAIKYVFDKLDLVAGVSASSPVLKYLDTINIKNDLKVKVSVVFDGEVMFAGEYGYGDYADAMIEFKPLLPGDYTVTYEFSDNANAYTYTYNAECISENVVAFAGAPLLQNYYILGMTYSKPDFTAYKFGSSITENSTKVSYSYDNGETWTEITNNTFVMGADAQGNYIATAKTVMFKYSSQGVADYITNAAQIVDVRTDAAISSGTQLHLADAKKQGIYANIEQNKYFVSDNAEFVNENAELVMKPTVNKGDVTATYINPLSFNDVGNIVLNFKTYLGANDFGSFTLTLTDAYDPTNFITVKMFMEGDDTKLSFNGKKAIASNVALKSGSPFEFKFNSDNKLISINDKRYELEFYPTNDLFYMSFTLGDITSYNVKLGVSNIGNHKFNTAKMNDTSAPMIKFTSSAGNYELNTVVTIYAPNVIDVLTPYCHVNNDGSNNTVTKVMKNGAAVMSLEGVKLDGTQDPTKNYTIKLDEYATWKVTYSVSDKAGKLTSYNYSISAIDVTPPTITLNYGFTKDTIHNVTLGKVFSIEYTVTDDITIETNVRVGVVIVRDSDFFTVYSSEPMEVVPNGEDHTVITDSCIITRSGMYTVYILALDEANNSTIVSYKLNVQK